jgi:enoyl-CoA hydratase/carnithine racemase
VSAGSHPVNTPIDVARYARDFSSLQFHAPEAGILELVIANKGRLNAATEAMHRDLAVVWRAIDTDDAVRVVVVRGEGENFSSGGDFDMINRMIDDEATLIRVWKEASDLVYNLINCSKPVVSAIRGNAVGAGLAIALLADVSIAADNARILDGHTRLGVAAGDHAVIIWPLLCGLAKARYHLLTNKSLSGAEAERIGLIAVAVPDAEVIGAAFDVARTLAAGSTTAIRWTKHALNNWLRLAGPSFDTSLALEFLGFKLADVREGLAAAREKRRPAFDRDKPE